MPTDRYQLIEETGYKAKCLSCDWISNLSESEEDAADSGNYHVMTEHPEPEPEPTDG
jgi:hypothetical protein